MMTSSHEHIYTIMAKKTDISSAVITIFQITEDIILRHVSIRGKIFIGAINLRAAIITILFG